MGVSRAVWLRRVRAVAALALIGVATGWLLAFAWDLGADSLAVGRERLPASAPRPRPTENTRPAPASSPAYPSAQLVREANAKGLTLRARLGEGFNVVVEAPFVVAGNLPVARLRQHLKWSIIRPARAMWASYFNVKCDKVITILLFGDGPSYRHWAEKLFGDKDVSYFGYFRHSDRTLVMNISTGTGKLVHELTHALIAFDWPGVPLWFNEGLASLHEQCRVAEDHITGLPNWRLRGLQNTIRAGKLRSLAELVTGDSFYGPLRGVNYAHARYFCLYLQHHGKLRQFYRRYRAAHAKGIPATKVIEEVSGERIGQLDKKLQAYVMKLKWD